MVRPENSLLAIVLALAVRNYSGRTKRKDLKESFCMLENEMVSLISS